MNVWLVSGAYLPAHGYGGPITAIQPLALALADLGVTTTVITSTLSAPGKADLPSGPELLDGQQIVRLSPWISYRWSSWPRLALPTPKPDIVHVFGTWNGMSYRLMPWAFARNIPVLWEPMGMLATRGRHHLLKRALNPFHRRLVLRSRGLLFTSRLERAEAPVRVIQGAPSFFRPNPLATRASGITKAEARRQLGLSQTGRLWGYLGRIAPRKGIESLLLAWPENANGSLLIAGPVEDSALAAACDARDNDGIRRLAALHGDDKWAFLAAIDALVLFPDFGENFGNVVAEAVAMRTPVVASPAVGACEWFADPGVVIADIHALAGRFTAGEVPPTPRGLPTALTPSHVAAEQLKIYGQL